MKKQFLQYLKDQVTKNELILSQNSISEEDKAILESTQDNLSTLISQLEELPEEASTAIEELKASLSTLDEQLTAIKEKINQNKEKTEEMNTQNFLSTQNSVKEFAKVIRNSKSADEFRTNWFNVLSTNGITIEEGSETAFIPDAVKGQITDIWDRNADWLKDLHITGALSFNCRFNNSDQTDEDSRAKGFKKGGTKTVQTIEVGAKLLKAQFIYKIQELDRETKFDTDEALISYVLGELVDQILYEIKRAILVGDGRPNNSDDKINSIEKIFKTSTDNFTTVLARDTNNFLIDDVVTTINTIKNDMAKPVYLFMTKSALTTLRRVQASETATPVYMPVEQVAEMVGASRIITTDLLVDEDMIAMIPDAYYLVGNNPLNPELYEWHEGYKNVDVIRYESYIGGGIGVMKSTAVLKED